MVNLTTRPVLPFSQASRDVNPLYHSAFPPEERPPYGLALLFSLRPAIAFTAYYEQETFIGFTITIKSPSAHFVFLFAIDQAVRSQGYGSAILQTIAKEAQGLAQVLCIEPLDPRADNYPQRLSRLAFYEKNGYRRQYRQFHELAEVYEVLATGNHVDYQELEQDLNRASLGLLKIRIEAPFPQHKKNG